MMMTHYCDKGFLEQIAICRSELAEVLNDTINLLEAEMNVDNLFSLLRRCQSNTAKIGAHTIYGRIDQLTCEIAEGNLIMIEGLARSIAPSRLMKMQDFVEIN